MLPQGKRKGIPIKNRDAKVAERIKYCLERFLEADLGRQQSHIA